VISGQQQQAGTEASVHLRYLPLLLWGEMGKDESLML